MRKIVIGFAFFVILGVAAYLRFHHSKPPMEVVYAGNRRVTLYSTTAQVREPVTTVSFGDRLDEPDIVVVDVHQARDDSAIFRGLS